MQPMPHQLMGYDRAITMFSPDGRLLQVEYAKKTVRQGSTAIGMTCSDGVLLVTDKRVVDPLIKPESIEKIWKIDDHIASTASGILSDARVLIERAQLKAQQHRVTFDTPIDVLSIVKDICDLKQICTQSGGLRPFGVSVIVAGVDNGKGRVFETDPTGIYFECRATVIGEGEVEIEEILQKEFDENKTIAQNLSLAIKALKNNLGENFNVERIDAAYIDKENKMFTKISRDKIDQAVDPSKDLKKIKKK